MAHAIRPREAVCVSPAASRLRASCRWYALLPPSRPCLFSLANCRCQKPAGMPSGAKKISAVGILAF